MRPSIGLLGGLVLLAMTIPASAEQYARESDIPELRLGQRIQVDDGTCPTGQIKEVTGTNLTAGGVNRVRKCVPRLGTKKN
ncbi:DUF6719 family protein [Rhodopseudomonas sp. P2A-2r]|jgi:hypothetical protein|uniref:DUF6719 family protein n=1 Tax=unclassified Rhodopseudomonas TaxID=2638247 RepID=UPI0022344009|nr:DUF6719 family protein [Rhodopseudomonas sp. P2A-2r]UZE47247.1 hypothetical protein ONR75_20010 [Rhodopseudomonas sp. P2A-2r]